MSDVVTEAGLDTGWLDICRRAERAACHALDPYPLGTAGRARETGRRGEGGDKSLVIDRAAEEAIIAELEATGLALTVITEERGRVELGGGGPVHVVVDPIDGSRNAKRGLPGWSVSIAVARGPLMRDVKHAFVRDCSTGEEWWATAGVGAYNDERPLHVPADPELEMVGLEMTRPDLVAEAAPGLATTGARRLRAIGSIALTACYVASGRLDGMVTLAPARTVDIAAAQLVLREAGGAIAFPDDDSDVELGGSLGLDWRSRVFAAAGERALARLLTLS